MPPATRPSGGQDARGQGAPGAEARALPVPGDVIAGKYQLVKVLGEGGMGVVFEATHLRLRQRVAVKMLQPDMLGHEVIVTRFEREARASGQLRNRHAARVMDVDVTPDGLPYMVMEFLEGSDLQVELERRGRLHYEEAVDYVLQACSAMIEAHQLGIVHRDLKPANLFLAIEDPNARDTRIVKVLDFGISKVQHDEGDERLTEAESVIGTAMYMSPEQLRSSGTVDARSDIWSLGVILYELLAGRPPWIGTPTQLAAAIVTEDAPDLRTQAPIPAEIAAIVTKTLRRDPAERYADVKQLALALAPFAPASGAGRVLAEGLLNSSSGLHPRMSIRPRMEEAQTIVQAPAISESRLGGSEGTAPGWSQQSRPLARRRTFVVGLLVAAAVGLLVVVGFAVAWLRAGAGGARAAAAQASASAAAASSAVGQASAAGSAESPPPIALEPAPPATGQGAGEPTPTTPPGPKARPASRPPASPLANPGATAKPAASAARPRPPAPPSENPLTL
jgi:serine/threonine protein kinase